MNFNYIEDNLISKYWLTLLRKNVIDIQNNKFIKKPYLENYIIQLSSTLNNDKLMEDINQLMDCNKITSEELFLFLNNSIELDVTDKKKIELYLFGDHFTNEFAIEIIVYQIEYFRVYNTITELLFDCNVEDNELYNFILIYIKNKKDEIKMYIKKNIKFNIFCNCLDKLFSSFHHFVLLLIKLKLLEKEYKKEDILNLFLKNLFSNWYTIYKKDILNNDVAVKIENFVIKKSILSRILCLPHL